MFDVHSENTISPSRRRPARVAEVAARLLLPFVVVGILLLTWLPAQEAGKVTGLVATLAELLSTVGVPVTVGYSALEFVANIALFVPLGICLAGGWPRLHGVAAIAIGMLLSIVIELVQLALPTRYATVSDIIANTVGTAVGVLAVALVRRAVRQPA